MYWNQSRAFCNASSRELSKCFTFSLVQVETFCLNTVMYTVMSWGGALYPCLFDARVRTQYVYTDIAYAFMFYCCLYFCLGAKIIMACRDMEKAQQAVKEVIESSGNENVVCMKLDLSDSKSIREFAEAINKGTQLEWWNKVAVTYNHKL